ncbi:uncharacterized protein EV420DRAFT_1729939 [Desarmillaria tabescens]|uniref:Dihydrodipicolinate synthetase n=1 Tax=Armillaria tabescens TaxID=1929756 RepID=A0AA39NE60_ARMTA|nr:uncharacterized protein EV420DRAFT_1729939 [Desarmillaria tabescens]KAK0463956.1 hypothetical protein EV420DRAFT_1729939 [Desarmillaria tabescens]
MAANGSNGVHISATRPLTPGIYAPIPTFFIPDSEDLDIPSLEAHVVRVAIAGVGPLITGSMGEAIHLSHTERMRVVKAARDALDTAGFTQVPVIVGTGAGSTRETVELTNEAAAAGADYSIVIASGYYAGAYGNNPKALKAFWTEVAAKSPIPVMIYNYPGASGGIDLDSDLITELAEDCGNVGKLTRIAASVSGPEFPLNHPRKNAAAPFLVLGGFTDFIVPSFYADGHGAITGLANVAPHAIAKLWSVTVASKQDLSLLPEALRLQGIIAQADFTIAKASIAGTKFLIEKLYGYGGVPRKPLPPMEASAAQDLWDHPHTQDLVRLEREIRGKAKA